MNDNVLDECNKNNQNDNDNDTSLEKIREQSKLLGEFFKTPKSYDHIAFEYLEDAIYMCYGAKITPGDYYDSKRPYYATNPIAMVTLEDAFYMWLVDIIHPNKENNNTIGIVFPGSNGYFPFTVDRFYNILDDIKQYIVKETRYFITIATLGRYTYKENYLSIFRNCNYVEDTSCFMRACTPKMDYNFLKLFKYRPKTEHIDIYGYSLGGGAALFALDEIANILVEEPDLLPNLKTIKIKTCSPTGVNNVNIQKLRRSVYRLLDHNPNVKIVILHGMGFGDNIPILLPIFFQNDDLKYNDRIQQMLVVVYDHHAPKVSDLMCKEFSSYLYRGAHFTPYSDFVLENISYAQVISGFSDINNFLKYGLFIGDKHEKGIEDLRSGTNYYNTFNGLKDLYSFEILNSTSKLGNAISDIFTVERDVIDIKNTLAGLLEQKLLSEHEVLHIISTLDLQQDKKFLEKFANYKDLYARAQKLTKYSINELTNTPQYGIVSNLISLIKTITSIVISNIYFVLWQSSKIFKFMKKIINKLLESIIAILFIIKFIFFNIPVRVCRFIALSPTLAYYHLVKKHEIKQIKDKLIHLDFYTKLQPKILLAIRNIEIKRLHINQNHDISDNLNTCQKSKKKIEYQSDKQKDKQSYQEFIKNKKEYTYIQRIIKFISKFLYTFGQRIYYH